MKTREREMKTIAVNAVTSIDLDDKILQALKKRAWKRGESFEESLRRVLIEAADEDDVLICLETKRLRELALI